MTAATTGVTGTASVTGVNAAAGGAGYQAEQVWCPASERLLEWDTDFHDLMLGDELRMAAFQAAITEAVRPGMTVLDLGTGTGILAQWALAAGAARVYGIDLNESILQGATARIEAAGYGDRWYPIAGMSFAIDLPERVDLVVSEIMGNLADNEGFGPILADARERFLAEDGTMLPRQVESYLVPVAATAAHAQIRDAEPVDAAGEVPFPDWLRRRGARNPFDLYYDVILPGHTYLSSPRQLRRYDLTTAGGTGSPDYRTHLVYTAHRDGLFTGFKGYFVATLSETVALDISGDDIAGRTTSDSWKHCYLPIAEPIPVRRGDRIALTFSRSAAGDATGAFSQGYQWVGQVVSGNGEVISFGQSTTGCF